jgi:cobalt/nickel transport protein
MNSESATSTKKNNLWVTLVLIAAVIVLAVIPLVMNPSSEFGGADDAAETIITSVQPDYQPWFHSFWTPPGSETESLLFALQASLGGIVIGYFFGTKRTERSHK